MNPWIPAVKPTRLAIVQPATDPVSRRRVAGDLALREIESESHCEASERSRRHELLFSYHDRGHAN
jgi:hypothetical protein